jgi:hypothetical protein
MAWYFVCKAFVCLYKQQPYKARHESIIMQIRDHALAGAIACSLALLLVTVPSHAILVDEGAYLEALENEEWLQSLPSELSSELAGMISDTLSLSSNNRASLEAHMLSIVSADWARDQAERIIMASVAVIGGSSATLEGYVDITPFRLTLLALLNEMVSPIIAAFVADYVPAQIPLSLLLGSDALGDIRSMVSVLGMLRYLSLAACIAMVVAGCSKRIHMTKLSVAWGIGLAGMLAAIGTFIVRWRIIAAFDAVSVGFVSSYGGLFASEYLVGMRPVLFCSLFLAALGLVFALKLNRA